MDESKGPLPLWKLEEVLLEARRELVRQMDFSGGAGSTDR